MEKEITKIKKTMNDLRVQNISLYFRDGKFYWTVKSCGFDSIEEAFADANSFFDLSNVNYSKENDDNA